MSKQQQATQQQQIEEIFKNLKKIFTAVVVAAESRQTKQIPMELTRFCFTPTTPHESDVGQAHGPSKAIHDGSSFLFLLFSFYFGFV